MVVDARRGWKRIAVIAKRCPFPRLNGWGRPSGMETRIYGLRCDSFGLV